MRKASATWRKACARATGNSETLSHRVEELNQKLERQQKDFAYRLCMLSAQQLDVDQDNGGLNCAATASASSAASTSGDGSSLPPLQNGDTSTARTDNMQGGPAPGPGILGTLPSGTPLPSAPDHRQYDAAMNLLAKAQYEQARTAFRTYADSHAGDDLAGDAIYWVGDIYYVQKDYPDAARAFAESIKKYPNSDRGPDSMLKLAQSLLAQARQREAAPLLPRSRPNIPTPRTPPSRRRPSPARPPAADAPAHAFAAAMARLDCWPGALAVSGGGDSIALMHLAARWAKKNRKAPPVILTVDHGLRAGSASEARKVKAVARKLGLAAHILAWKSAKPRGDIEAAARAARYRLMGAWCAKNGIAALYVGHTEDDQAETFLLRLARGSGLDGLTAMRACAPFPDPAFSGIRLARPLLELNRADLRAWLIAAGQGWSEDPMNGEARFARVRMRGALAALEEAGLSRGRICDAARHLLRAREALEMVTDAVLLRCCHAEKELVALDALALAAAPREVGLRALATTLMRVSGQAYRPRFEALERLFDRLGSRELGGGCTLHGCRIAPAPGRQAFFGPGTVLIRPEVPRKAPKTKSPASKGL